jgi:hypothetical protein
MRKRWAKVVLVSLLLGMAINVAVAWALMVRFGVPTAQPRRWHQGSAEATFAWRASVPQHWPAASNSWGRVEWWNCTIDDQMVVQEERPEMSRHVYGGHWVRVVAWGWPRKSLGVVWMREEPITMDSEGMPHREQGIRGGLPMPAQFQRGPWANRLPLMPVWPGFAVNTLLYGAFAGLVLFAPGATRRMLRHRRGACIGCGYDLAGLGRCPECGKHAEARGSAGQNA